MQQSSKHLYFLAPFRGFAYFLTHPNLWLLPIISVFILTIILLIIFTVVLLFSWPLSSVPWPHYLWDVFKGLGYSTAAILVGFIILMPIIVMGALDKMVRKVLFMEEGKAVQVGIVKSFYSGTVIFFKTIFWRIFWPIVGVICAIFLGPVGVFISQLGIGHLAIIDGVDLTLALKGLNTEERLRLYKENSFDIFTVGFCATLLSMALSITILGWILWIPAVFCGTTLWVKDWVKT